MQGPLLYPTTVELPTAPGMEVRGTQKAEEWQIACRFTITEPFKTIGLPAEDFSEHRQTEQRSSTQDFFQVWLFEGIS